MTRKKRRLYMLGLALLGLGTATALTLSAFEENIVFFYSPSDLVVQPPGDRSVRLGGLVEDGSVQKQADGLTITFRVTDTANTVPVTYKGIVPDLFREGQGVVAEGRMGGDGVFVAREVLARHDENYMPPEVHDALQRAGAVKTEVPGRSIYTPADSDDKVHATTTLKP
ncbi:cytochrome c maturation protein CcmE [Rhodospirillum centenum]|uniref:Cytochrome c-type biogenesis protein CcmE n=1 Tax=Rhodospirillum centenum (strain ATCC 51521 / SW) TaxID=414684 RepID=CCME_RHOCS|nr:cytochrome c maturation protein CcmE [Rhodospirillum centenum]B6IVR1.1 RecName: Full=Cytochrome c-type biogenesis protein CcmE; AltName: Full=Cytochrome c maturation protein E; AltName: Full=Heme chaperone CcmE [Rhodospirillum centenum SW]ACJ00385.1 cytochrome c-type biogenesis protein CcmE [Rhodospirillum centenum SW]